MTAEQFLRTFRLLPAGQSPGHPWLDGRLVTAAGYLSFASALAGSTFENGLYRLHDADTGPLGDRLIEEAFPEFASRACPFGYDWLGRQFALDSGRMADGEPLVLLLEPGTGQALEVPSSFMGFHGTLDDLREPALAADFFGEWARANPDLLPLRRSDCVGYRVPLSLGAMDTLDNLEVIDFDVYWSICGQLLQGTRSLPAGTSVRQLAIESPDELLAKGQ